MSLTSSPKLLKGGIVLIDPETGATKRTIPLQYNPDTLTRTLQPQGAGAESGDRSEALRLKSPPVETFKLEAILDATDRLAEATASQKRLELSVAKDLAALETMIYPSSTDIERNDQMAASGTLEILPMMAALTVFVWSRDRVTPVRITEFGIVEEAFDPDLNPIRAKVSLGLRVLSVSDLPAGSKASGLYMAYHKRKEQLIGATSAALDPFGVGSIG